MTKKNEAGAQTPQVTNVNNSSGFEVQRWHKILALAFVALNLWNGVKDSIPFGVSAKEVHAIVEKAMTDDLVKKDDLAKKVEELPKVIERRIVLETVVKNIEKLAKSYESLDKKLDAVQVCK